MKLPVLWIAGAFTAGIVLANQTRAAPRPWIAAATIAILLGGIFVWRKHLAAAGIFALLAWAALGGVAVHVERTAVPANHITRLLAQEHLERSVPLRWRGRMRQDPLQLPWGNRYEINLEAVETAGQSVPLSGGLRVNFYKRYESSGAPGGLRAGDRVEALLWARPPRNFKDPGAFDIRGTLAREGTDLTGSLRSGELLRLIDRPNPTFMQRLARARGDLLARLDALFAGQPDREAVLRAMLLGDRSFVDSRVVTVFQQTAVYHVLVVAGLHVGALAVFFFWVCRRLRFPLSVTSLVTLAALAAYVGVVQDRPPILRAALMTAFYLGARPLFRRVELLNTVGLAALVILVWKPSSLPDSSFQLSFLAAGVIAGLAMPWVERTSAPYRAGLAHLGDVTRDVTHPPKVAQFRIEVRAAAHWLAAHLPDRCAGHAGSLVSAPIRVSLRLWEILLLSAVIQWGMMPLLAKDFHRISLAGPLCNIPAVILTGIIVPLGFMSLGVAFVSVRVARILAMAVGSCAGLLLDIVERFSRWPRAFYRIPGPPAWLVVAFFAAVVCLAAGARTATAKRAGRIARRQLPPRIHAGEWIAAAALAALTILVATYPFAPQLAAGKLEVSVLDVGQGDSIFVAFPGGQTMLIDGGGQPGSTWQGGYRSAMDIGEEVVSPYLWSRGLKSLDVVALTHAHHDHIDGLRSVLQNFHVGAFWIGRDEQTPAFQSLLAEARSRGVRIVHEIRGDEFEWGGAGGEALWPVDSSPVTGASNEDSLTLRLEDASVRFLLTGDIQQDVEHALVEEHAPIAADFLKVPHHGSKTSSTEEFVAAVKPRVAVISVGQSNPFGHPAESVVERYEKEGVRLLRTDRDGAVTALTDGRNLAIRTFTQSQPE